jgi:hypothetical protein
MTAAAEAGLQTIHKAQNTRARVGIDEMDWDQVNHPSFLVQYAQFSVFPMFC